MTLKWKNVHRYLLKSVHRYLRKNVHCNLPFTLHSDRMSCNDFHANQFRLFMHSVAYVLLHTLRSEMLRLTEFARATMQTIQLRLIKVAAFVKEMKTRIKIEFPKKFPSLDVIANSLCMFKVCS